ncbi:hypothetical protein COLO4_08704 [Corchorus olitorius]|uniref:Uncharacterized protein n=1 Tax=Corchorus olitorius TaxID=93759 RepID=A0A1R3KEY1_9ROSI|nr:hypothetical protein COLO4_08704 [Corchorus olitorius]
MNNLKRWKDKYISIQLGDSKWNFPIRWVEIGRAKLAKLNKEDNLILSSSEREQVEFSKANTFDIADLIRNSRLVACGLSPYPRSEILVEQVNCENMEHVVGGGDNKPLLIGYKEKEHVDGGGDNKPLMIGYEEKEHVDGSIFESLSPLPGEKKDGTNTLKGPTGVSLEEYVSGATAETLAFYWGVDDALVRDLSETTRALNAQLDVVLTTEVVTQNRKSFDGGDATPDFNQESSQKRQIMSKRMAIKSQEGGIASSSKVATDVILNTGLVPKLNVERGLNKIHMVSIESNLSSNFQDGIHGRSKVRVFPWRSKVRVFPRRFDSQLHANPQSLLGDLVRAVLLMRHIKELRLLRQELSHLKGLDATAHVEELEDVISNQKDRHNAEELATGWGDQHNNLKDEMDAMKVEKECLKEKHVQELFEQKQELMKKLKGFGLTYRKTALSVVQDKYHNLDLGGLQFDPIRLSDKENCYKEVNPIADKSVRAAMDHRWRMK